MSFTAYHLVSLLIFVVEVKYAVSTISKLRNTTATYNCRLLPFAWLSLSSWIAWALQYFILPDPFASSPPDFLLTGLWLGVMQSALWTIAVLSLRSKQFPRILDRLPFHIIFAITIAFALCTYRISVLTSKDFFLIEAAVTAVIFTTFAHSIWQWRLSKFYVAVFLIHGFTQWVWRLLWFGPLESEQIPIFWIFPVWHISLLLAWIKLILAILRRAESSHLKVVENIKRLHLPYSLKTITAMIASTTEDLAEERDAASLAITGLGLTEVGAEISKTPSHGIRNASTSLADDCHIFLLIIGARYGPPMTLDGVSLIEFKYDVARRKSSEKILVYVKDHVIREPRLQDFLTRVVAEQTYVRLFATPEGLYEEIHRGIAEWLVSHAATTKASIDSGKVDLNENRLN